MTHIVKAGDTLIGLAKKYGVTVEAIMQANPSIKNPNLIYDGQVLVIPVKDITLKEALANCLSDIEKLDSYKKVVQMLNA